MTLTLAAALCAVFALFSACNRASSEEPAAEWGADLVGTGSAPAPDPFPGPCDIAVSGDGPIGPLEAASRVSTDHDYDDNGNETRRVEVFNDGSRLITTSHFDTAGNILREVRTLFLPEEGTCCGRDTQYSSQRSTTTYDYSCW